ncbi:hypothetical protein ALC60_00943 [Trachymyrmex zeteki]|uniref:Transmembrane protein n=1 Tax=Mycetomoellerius zeteki TaxID=64791 RepID=A0A151XI72_9HYME|nr:hypothetical protein ALC60_00943 [Trachymyrmex zeteki]
MANNLECCKIATFENFNLSLPSFMMVKFYKTSYFSCTISILCFIFLTFSPNFVSDFESIVLDRSSVFKDEIKSNEEDTSCPSCNSFIIITFKLIMNINNFVMIIYLRLIKNLAYFSKKELEIHDFIDINGTNIPMITLQFVTATQSQLNSTENNKVAIIHKIFKIDISF